MKKTVLILITILTLCLFNGCGGEKQEAASASGSAGQVDLSSLKTIGDAMTFEGKDEETVQRSTYNGKYIYVFTVGGNAYRVTADLSSDLEEKIYALEFDDDYDKNEAALVQDLPISTAEDLSEQILSQEELDALVGKTGQELMDMGWRSGSFYNWAEKEAWLEYGPYAYSIHFDGEDVTEENSDDFDEIEDMTERKVLDATFQGLGDATNID